MIPMSAARTQSSYGLQEQDRHTQQHDQYGGDGRHSTSSHTFTIFSTLCTRWHWAGSNSQGRWS